MAAFCIVPTSSGCVSTYQVIGRYLMHKKEKTEKLKKNIKYLIESRGETRISLCSSSGLTRTTIYNILEGRVVNVQESTIRKISDFFGVSYKEIETVDFEEREIIESTVSLHGNMNPAAVPVIKESLLLQSLEKRIGELAISQPLTYYFGAASNLIGVLLESEIVGANEVGDLLIVRKGVSISRGEKLVYDKRTRKLTIVADSEFDADVLVIGELIEERFNVGRY
jgi:transcriptional regulator with XRE-family HTH domain